MMINKILNFIINNSNNILIKLAVMFFCPNYFLKKILGNNKRSGILWIGKKACLTISFDCDYPRDIKAIPFLLELLSKYNIKTSFACVGHWVEEYPLEHKMILERGHEIMNHTYSHPDNEILNPGRKFKEISIQEKSEEIEKCHNICKKILNYEPVGCRIPHFKNLFSEDVYGILNKLGYAYSSSTLISNTKSFGMPFITKEGIYEFPLSACPRHPFTVFDTWHSFNSPRWFYKISHQTENEYINLFKLLVDTGIRTNSYLNIYIDPYDIIRMNNFEDLLIFLKQKTGDLAILPYNQILNILNFSNSSGAIK